MAKEPTRADPRDLPPEGTRPQNVTEIAPDVEELEKILRGMKREREYRTPDGELIDVNEPIVVADEEYLAISRGLERHHALFYTFWQMGRPNFEKWIDTAWVAAAPDDPLDVQFFFHPGFWMSLTTRQRTVVIAHECLHIILNHIKRACHAQYGRIANIAMDIVVNELLVTRFGFRRTDFPDPDNICFADNTFPRGMKVRRGGTFEYYYHLLMEHAKILKIKIPSGKDGEDGDGSGIAFPDDHSGWRQMDPDDIVKSMNENMETDEKQSVKSTIDKHWLDDEEPGKHQVDSKPGGKHAGKHAGNLWTFVENVKPKVKKKWETVIKKWAALQYKWDRVDLEQWTRKRRRLMLLDSDLLMPSEIEDDKLIPKHKRIPVWFFMDTSGSCANYKDRFWKAAMSLDKKRFDIHWFCFDTRCYHVDPKKKKLYGFGGTSFMVIERFIKQECVKPKYAGKYPKAVFVLTDGYGDEVSPLHPERWFWFLTEGYGHYIPEKSHKYDLRDFE